MAEGDQEPMLRDIAADEDAPVETGEGLNAYYWRTWRRERMRKHEIARPVLRKLIDDAKEAGREVPLTVVDDVAEQTGLHRDDVSMTLKVMLRDAEIIEINTQDTWNLIPNPEPPSEQTT
jgi:hypothetical protein